MSTVNVNFAEKLGMMKPMNAVNNGPIGHIIPKQNRNNFEEYKAARIPYARNHDASEWIDYGGEFVVDIYSLFPNFDADPYDPANYDFPVTDALVKFTQDTGTEVYYRLGARIEHQCKKYRTVMPKDFKKWAVICEHVIRHYNGGWADGFHYGIKYWEIWNEPDLDNDATPVEKRRNWSGSRLEFFEFFCVAAEHLKKCFPELKIGGPAIASISGDFLDSFLAYITKDGRHTPLDFFSWHCYATDPQKIVKRARIVREKLDRAGYAEAESHLNEWNYIADWGDKWLDTIKEIIGLRGASFIAACMCEGQNEPSIDMMMYYEVSPTTMNGIFDFYTCKPIKGYWALYGFSDLCELGTHVKAASDDPDVYVTAAGDGKGRGAALVCYYTNDEGREDKTITVELGENATVEIYTVDEIYSYDKTAEESGERVTITLKPNSFAVLKAILQ